MWYGPEREREIKRKRVREISCVIQIAKQQRKSEWDILIHIKHCMQGLLNYAFKVYHKLDAQK